MTSQAAVRSLKSTFILPIVALLAVAACSDDRPPEPAEVAAHMSEHFTRASDLQRAVVNGDMEAP